MPLTLHNLKSAKGSRKKRKRVGRGNASKHGTYSTRGVKGQRSRSGGKKGLKLKGFKSTLLNIPKVRGFKSPHPKLAVINIKDLETHFKEGEKVTPKVLNKKGLISTIKPGVKILSKGELKKKLVFSGCQFSENARKKIEDAKGEIKNKS